MDEGLIYSVIPIAVVGLITLIVGILIGALLSWSLRSRSSDDSRAATKNLNRVLSLWRDRKGGKLVVDLDGQLYSSAGRMNARQLGALRETFNELHSWVGIDNMVAAAPIESSPPGEKTPIVPAELPPVSYIPISQQDIRTVKPPSMQLGDILARAINPEPKYKGEDSEAPKSIAAQVDEILQERLPASPLQGRSIRLVDVPGRGLIVTVDGKSYEGVSEIPDDEVRKLIQECVAVWEKTR